MLFGNQLSGLRSGEHELIAKLHRMDMHAKVWRVAMGRRCNVEPCAPFSFCVSFAFEIFFIFSAALFNSRHCGAYTAFSNTNLPALKDCQNCVHSLTLV